MIYFIFSKVFSVTTKPFALIGIKYCEVVMDKDLEYISQTQTLVGTQQKRYMDVDTGEVIAVDQVSKRIYGTKNFWKCYLMDFLTVLGIIDSRQLDIFIYIVENTNQTNNLFIGTYKKICDDTKCSSTTIAKIMKKLQENSFIKKVQNGVWLVNPNILMKGNDTKRQILLSYFQSDEPINEITLSRTKRRAIENMQVPDFAPNGEQEDVPLIEDQTIEDQTIEEAEQIQVE